MSKLAVVCPNFIDPTSRSATLSAVAVRGPSCGGTLRDPVTDGREHGGLGDGGATWW
jgi:hypothetical protein